MHIVRQFFVFLLVLMLIEILFQLFHNEARKYLQRVQIVASSQDRINNFLHDLRLMVQCSTSIQG